MSRRGFSLIELLIAIAIILIIASIVITSGGDSLRLAQETSAVRHIQTIQTAQTQHLAQEGKFAATLSDLGPSMNLIPEDLASGRKGGYLFTLQSDGSTYTIHAKWHGSKSGHREFYSDQTLVIRESRGEPVGPSSKPVGSN